MKKHFKILVLILILVAILFGLNKLTAKTKPQNSEAVAREGIEVNIYNAELTNIIGNPSAPLAGDVSVDLPAGSCIDFKYTNPVSLNDTLFSGCNSERDKPLPDILEIQKSGKMINIFGEYDFTDCQSIKNECIVNLIINKIETIN